MKLSTIARLFLIGLISVVKADDNDPKTIFKKAIASANQVKTLKAEMEFETIGSLEAQKVIFYQKAQPDGKVLARVDHVFSANAKNFTNNKNSSNNFILILPQGTYNVIGNQVASTNEDINFNEINHLMRLETLKKSTQDDKSAKDFYTVNYSEFNGKECFAISIPTLPFGFEAIKNILEKGPLKEFLAKAKIRMEAIPIPAKTVMLVDKESLLLMKLESMGINNKTISSISFKNIETNIEISDDFFQLPEPTE